MEQQVISTLMDDENQVSSFLHTFMGTVFTRQRKVFTCIGILHWRSTLFIFFPSAIDKIHFSLNIQREFVPNENATSKCARCSSMSNVNVRFIVVFLNFANSC